MPGEFTIKLEVGFQKSDGSVYARSPDVTEPNVIVTRETWVSDRELTDAEFDSDIDSLVADGRLFKVKSAADIEPDHITLNAVRHD